MSTAGRSGARVRRRMTVRRAVTVTLLCLLLVAVLLASYGILSLWRSLRTMNPGTTGSQSRLNLDNHVNIVLLGTDSRAKEDPGRSDSIMLVGLDPATKSITLLSIPRDTRVSIPGHGFDKINAATNGDYFADGGVDLLKRTIETMLPGILVDYYVQANFDGFEKVVDALGGVTIDVQKTMYYKSDDTLIDLKPGIQLMDGKTALGYARFRMDATGDYGYWNGEEYGRVARQKELLRAIVAQTTTLRNVWRLPPIIRAVEEAVITDLLPNDLLRIALAFKNATDEDVALVGFPGTPGYVDGISYVLPDLDALQASIAPLFAPGASQ
jgi:LCP family protein required for cell wall assembly